MKCSLYVHQILLCAVIGKFIAFLVKLASAIKYRVLAKARSSEGQWAGAVSV